MQPLARLGRVSHSFIQQGPQDSCPAGRICVPTEFAGFSLTGSSPTVLPCAHRLSDFPVLYPYPAGRLVWSPLRASSDHSFTVGALRAQRPCQLPRPSPSKLARYTLQRVAWIGLNVRASNDINDPSKLARDLSGVGADCSPTARGHGAHCACARCASTGDQQPPSPPPLIGDHPRRLQPAETV
jgi:hypothetical protein